MSYVLEAIADPSTAQVPAGAGVNGVAFESFRLDDAGTLLVRPGGRVKFSPQMLKIAEELSGQSGDAMLIRWDDRAGVREAVVFHDGETQGEHDEVYVELDDEGKPNLAGPQYTTEEVDELDDDDIEVERIADAIQIACQSTHWCPETSIKDFIRSQR